MVAGESSSAHVAALEAELEAMRRSLSWRVTQPLRAVRRRSLSAPRRSVVAPIEPTAAHRAGLARRVEVVLGVVGVGRSDPVDEVEPLVGLIADLVAAGAADGVAAWMTLVAATGRYPLPGELEAARRVVRREGTAPLLDLAERAFQVAVIRGVGLPDLEVVRDGVLVDITQTTSQDLHSGIQRVARECSARWLADRPTELVHFDEATPRLVRLSDTERDRAVHWQDHLHGDGTEITARVPSTANGATIVPIGCVHVIPEYVESGLRVDAYVALRDAGVTRGLSMIGYDLIPITASELTYPGSTQSFGRYLSLVKRADVVTAISTSSAREFRAFLGLMPAQGRGVPSVVDRALSSGGIEVTANDLAATRRAFALGTRPLVLAVGSHEPRKNHVTIVEAAGQLWSDGYDFDLLLVGAFGWGTDELTAEVQRLAGLGRSIQVARRVDERTLWSLYRLATFSIFVSLVEGFGLPIVESLRCGTPVIASRFGAMAEAAAGGGAVIVDPRDPADVGRAMGRLLDRPDEIEELRREALARTWTTWADYAADVWTDLVATRWTDGGLSDGAPPATTR